jgi:short-subunit dehydrogenase
MTVRIALRAADRQDGVVEVWEPAGKTVIVTGASSGIGAATARLLHQARSHPVLAARRGDRLESLSRELGGGLAVPTDVTDRAAIQRLVEATLARYGRIDGLVNNAGVSLYGRLDELNLNEFAGVLALNVVSVLAMTQAVLPAMRAQRAGRIVNISSGTTRMVLPGVGGYAATKSALNMLTSVSRKELEADGIAVSLVLPSITATEFGGGRYQLGKGIRPGMIAQSPEYVGQVILRALRTGEERIDIPHGAEQPQLTSVPPLQSRPAAEFDTTAVDRAADSPDVELGDSRARLGEDRPPG